MPFPPGPVVLGHRARLVADAEAGASESPAEIHVLLVGKIARIENLSGAVPRALDRLALQEGAREAGGVHEVRVREPSRARLPTAAVAGAQEDRGHHDARRVEHLAAGPPEPERHRARSRIGAERGG